MNSVLSNSIAHVITWLKSLRLNQVLIVLFASLLVVTSTACRSADPRYSNNVGVNQDGYSTSSPYDKDNGPTRELYKPTQEPKGGMNNYSDDLKYRRSEFQNSIDRRVNQAERNLDRNQTRSPGDVFSNIQNRNPLDDKARQSYENTTESAKRLADDFSEGTRQGTRNFQENLDRAADNTPRILNEAKRNAQGAADDVREGTEAILQGARNAAERAGDVVQDRADDAANAVRDRF